MRLLIRALLLIPLLVVVPACDEMQSAQPPRQPASTHKYPEACPELALDVREYLMSELIETLNSEDSERITDSLTLLLGQRDAVGRCASMEFYSSSDAELSDFYSHVSGQLTLIALAAEIGAKDKNSFALADARSKTRKLEEYLRSFGDLEVYLTRGTSATQ